MSLIGECEIMEKEKITAALKKKYTARELITELCYSSPLSIFILFTAFSLALRIYYSVLTGIKTPNINYNYDTGFFVNGAKLLLSSPGEYFSQFITMPFYMGYTMTLAAVYAVTGGSNLAVVILQIILSSLCAFLVWKSCENFFDDRRVSFLCGAMTVILPISYRWVSQITSDCLGTFASVLCLWLFSEFIAAEKGKRRRQTILLVLSMLGFFLMRTTAITVIIVLAVAVICELPPKKRTAVFLVIAAAAAAAVILLLKDNGVHSVNDNTAYFKELFEKGEVIHMHYYYDTKGNITDLFGIVFYRLLFYFCPLDIGVGIIGGHRLSYQLLHYLPLFPVFIFTSLGVVRGMAEKKRIIVIFTWVIVISALVQSVTEIQYDLRYRDPVLPYFYMIAAFEIIHFADSIKKNREIICNEA